MQKISKLKQVRDEEGLSLSQLAVLAAPTSVATLRKAESGEPIRDHIWGRILKGLNSSYKKNKTYTMDDIKD